MSLRLECEPLTGSLVLASLGNQPADLFEVVRRVALGDFRARALKILEFGILEGLDRQNLGLAVPTYGLLKVAIQVIVQDHRSVVVKARLIGSELHALLVSLKRALEVL